MVSGGLSSLATRALDAGVTVRASAALLAVGIVLTVFAIAAGSRAVQGVATSIALATLGALIADTAPQWAATLNSVTAFMGLALGALISGVFVTFAPWPTHLVYAVLLGVTLAEILILAWIVETTSRKAGAWIGMRPKLTVPRAAAAAMARLFPLTLSAWALGGFYLSLMPSLMIEGIRIRSPLVGAAVVSAPRRVCLRIQRQRTGEARPR
jgi:MFS family permease